jgi:hypothetical protein
MSAVAIDFNSNFPLLFLDLFSFPLVYALA